MNIRVLLISNSENNLGAIKSLIDDQAISVIGESAGGTVAFDMINNLSPDIVIMTLGDGDSDVLSMAERIILSRPRTYVILLAEQIDVDLLQSAIKVGARNVTQFPKTAKEFGEYIKTVYANETTRSESFNIKQDLNWMSRVITVFGAKGGLGKTTLAINLAVDLAEKHKKVAIVDLDLQFGDTHVFLDIEPTDTIFELVQEVSTPTIDLIRSYMTVHSSGVHVLCAPKSPEYAELISPDKVKSILAVLRTYYDYVIIDTPPFFTEMTITAIESATIVLFVTCLELSTLKNSKLSLSLLESLHQMDKIKLLVNRADSMCAITLDDVQKLIDCPIWAKIPNDYKVAVSALNRGIPFVIGAPKSELSQSVASVANFLLEGNADIDTLNTKQKKRLGLLNNNNNKGSGFFKNRKG